MTPAELAAPAIAGLAGCAAGVFGVAWHRARGRAREAGELVRLALDLNEASAAIAVDLTCRLLAARRYIEAARVHAEDEGDTAGVQLTAAALDSMAPLRPSEPA